MNLLECETARIRFLATGREYKAYRTDDETWFTMESVAHKVLYWSHYHKTYEIEILEVFEPWATTSQ